uniref:DEAD/DEAH box helicase n=1 Tax=uncultured bacterium Ak20-3 TaxID=798570 RepID=D9MX78_9BACT|nr:hypothetical protein AKSOIL_0347 [uncultured bacterium Ak20-3]
MKIFTKTLGRLGLSDDSTLKQANQEQLDSEANFKDFPFDMKLQQVIADEGFSIPTPIQVRAIPIVLEGKDIIACAQTGTGKTAAFALPILHKLVQDAQTEKQRSYHPKVLVLVPTRELALQVQETFAAFGHNLGVNSIAIIGGVSVGQQMVNLRRRSPQVVVATPGRLLDILEQGGINLSSIHTLILDEADRMLDMGFIPDTKRIVKAIPKERQSLMFSATISSEVNALSKQIMNTPVHISVAPKRASAEGIEQLLYSVPGDNKRALLFHLLENDEMNRVIIFTRTKFGASKLSDSLIREGIRSKVIHSGKSQAARQSVWEHFRSGKLRVLVATDLASRGIDVDGISHVVNYDLPDCAETYIHRIGRTGRANKTGIALSFCSPDQRRLLTAIERHLGKTLPVCKDHPFMKPTGKADRQSEESTEDVSSEDMGREPRGRSFDEGRDNRRPFSGDSRRPSRRNERRPHRINNQGSSPRPRREFAQSQGPSEGTFRPFHNDRRNSRSFGSANSNQSQNQNRRDRSQQSWF